MDEQHNEFDQPAEPVGPEIDDSGNPTEAAPDSGDKPRAPAGREMLIQLQQMIDTITYQAKPVVREVAAKAAELASIAGQKAGPLAYRAAEVTESVGQRVAAKSAAVASDLRRPREDGDNHTDDSSADMGQPADQGESAPSESASSDQGPGDSDQDSNQGY